MTDIRYLPSANKAIRDGCPDREHGAIDFGRAASLWFASSAEPAAPGAVQGQDPVRFKTVSGLELEITIPELKLALYELGRVWPHALVLSDLAERVTEHVGSPISAEALGRRLLDSAASAAVRVFVRPPPAVRAPGEKPKTTPLARLEALRGTEVTNLHHEPVTIDVAFHRALLALLDGSHDTKALVRSLVDRIEAGSLEVPGIDPSARSRWEGLLGREVEAGLERLARFALLSK